MVKFFINRPIFATVLALIIVVAGLVTLNILPIAQYPEITPPTVQVSAVYPGADAQTVAQTVGLPIEQQVNGVDGMLYMSSNSSSSGAYSLTITFAAIFIGFFLIVLLNICISEYMNLFFVFLLTFPIFQLGVYIDKMPALPYFVLLLFSYFMNR